MAEVIYFLRHGKTKDLEDDIRSRQDTALIPEGRQDIRRKAQEMKDAGMEFDLIIASPLHRTRETAEEIADVFGYPLDDIMTDIDLREQEWGISEGMPNQSVDKEWGGDIDKVPYAETENHLAYRARQVLTRILQRPEQRILIVGHGTYGRKLRQVAARMEGRDRDVPDFRDNKNGKIKPGEVIILYQRPTQRV